MATRHDVVRLLGQGLDHAAVGRMLGIAPGAVFMIETGRPADTSSGAVAHQDLVNPPAHNPTTNDTVLAWVRARAEADRA